MFIKFTNIKKKIKEKEGRKKWEKTMKETQEKD